MANKPKALHREPGRAGAKPGGAGRGGVPFAVGVGSWRTEYDLSMYQANSPAWKDLVSKAKALATNGLPQKYPLGMTATFPLGSE